MADITFITGDATNPDTTEPAYIVHCCNSVGAWGSGFVMALSKKWKLAEKRYRFWAAGAYEDLPDQDAFELGGIQIVGVAPHDEIFVVNMIGQQGIRYSKSGLAPIRYEAFREGLRSLSSRIPDTAVVHMPRMGCDLAGGSWALVEDIIRDELVANDIDVVVYDFPGGKFNP